MAEKHLFSDFEACLNLGGIANISIPRLSLGFDVSPCNLLLNYFANAHDKRLSFDENGAIASGGAIIERLEEMWDALPYYQSDPPKSTGREWVEEHVLPAAVDKVGAKENESTFTC
jgi:anhydro-N-acetylmuramic acid kinase